MRLGELFEGMNGSIEGTWDDKLKHWNEDESGRSGMLSDTKKCAYRNQVLDVAVRPVSELIDRAMGFLKLQHVFDSRVDL